MKAPRKHTVFYLCERHGWLGTEPRERRAEFFAEGGPTDGPCSPDHCQAWPGTDLFIPEVCDGPYIGVHVPEWGVNREAASDTQAVTSYDG